MEIFPGQTGRKVLRGIFYIVPFFQFAHLVPTELTKCWYYRLLEILFRFVIPGLSLFNFNSAAIHHATVEFTNGFFSCCLAAHTYKSKAFAAVCEFVTDNIDKTYFSVRSKLFL